MSKNDDALAVYRVQNFWTSGELKIEFMGYREEQKKEFKLDPNKIAQSQLQRSKTNALLGY